MSPSPPFRRWAGWECRGVGRRRERNRHRYRGGGRNGHPHRRLHGSDSHGAADGDGAQLTGLLLSPPLASLVVGQSQQFQATALYDDGTRQTVTGAALWTSSASNVLAVSNGGGGGGPGGGGGATPKGYAVALAAGQASVTATYLGQAATIGVTVVAPTLMEVQVTPTNPTLAKGATLQFMAVAVYSDFSTVNVTNTASWTSSAPTVATITNGGAGGRGRASGVSAGKSTVSATYLGITGSTLLTVTDAQVMTIRVTPASASLPVGIDQRFTATATLTDATMRDVTNLATWSTSDGTVAAVSDSAGTQGTVTPLAPGMVTVTATYAGVVGSTALTVSNARLTSIVVTGVAGNLAVGGHQQLTATATFDDGTMFDVTQQVTWISQRPQHRHRLECRRLAGVGHRRLGGQHHRRGTLRGHGRQRDARPSGRELSQKRAAGAARRPARVLRRRKVRRRESAPCRRLGDADAVRPELLPEILSRDPQRIGRLRLLSVELGERVDEVGPLEFLGGRAEGAIGAGCEGDSGGGPAPNGRGKVFEIDVAAGRQQHRVLNRVHQLPDIAGKRVRR